MIHQTVDQFGYRSSTSRAYLPVEFVTAHRNRLHICTNAVVRKVEVTELGDGSLSATGVIVQSIASGSPTIVVTARKEIILSCGALGTPQVLMLRYVNSIEHYFTWIAYNLA
jgi:choline dehydrogenase